MNEHIEQAWTDGFTKAANEAGITDPEEVMQLLVLAKRAQLAAGHMDAYEEGVAKAAAEAGLEKEAILPLLAGGALAAGGLARWRNKGQDWNQMSDKDMAAGSKAYESKGLLGKGWAHLTNPAMIQAVKGQRASGAEALKRQQNPAQYQAYAKQQATEAQNKADAWGGGTQSRGRSGSYYGRHYRRPRY